MHRHEILKGICFSFCCGFRFSHDDASVIHELILDQEALAQQFESLSNSSGIQPKFFSNTSLTLVWADH